MKTKLKLFSIILAILLVVSSAYGVLNAAAYYSGQWVGMGTVTSTTSRAVATGVTYDNIYVKDTSSSSQRIQTITFNPKTSNYVPLVYTNFSGYGGTTYNSAVKAETIGYDVKGGVNASFFSFTGSSCNTYGGVNISDGKILQGNNSYGANWMLAFNSDGSASLVWSKVDFALVAKDNAWSAPVDCINICPETTYAGIYYYDEFCGTKTDTKAAGVEIVFEKQNGTELTVGGTLVGKVVEIRSNTSSGGAIGSGRFVLYASDSSSYAAYLRGFAVGDKVEITASETIEGAKTVMENCNSAFVTYGYHIVSEGVNVTSTNGLGESFNTASAQRSAIGVKADGTIILVASHGRTTTYPGLTVYELADFLISQGCVTAVNLDGGGSTQMTVENSSGSLEATLSSTRRVANSILVVARPTIDAADRTELKSLIDEAAVYATCYELGGEADYFYSAYEYAKGVYNASTSMPGDYTKAIMRLRKGLGGITVIGRLKGIYQIDTAVSMLDTASAGGTAVASLEAGKTVTVTDISGDYGYTEYLGVGGWIDLNNATPLGLQTYPAATVTAPEIAYKGQDITISWADIAGASAYGYKVIELAGEPDPGNSNESEGATVLAESFTTSAQSVAVPASARTDGKYLKVAVCVEYPDRTIWKSLYITTSELPFTDIAPDYWGYASAKHCYENGYFSGTSATTFSPDGTMTRAMMATVIYRMAGEPELDTAVELPFTDISDTAWYYNGIAWGYANGIITGVSATEFAPDALVTREQAAIFLYRLANHLGCDTTVTDESIVDSFADGSSVSSYARTAMAWANEQGIISGNDGYINPQATATRIQIAAMLMKFDNSVRV